MKKGITRILLIFFAIGLHAGDQQDSKANLVMQGAYLLASSFRGDNSRTVKTDSYYVNLQDGKANTFWRPMDKEAPHWIEIHWRYPLQINRFSYQGRGLEQAVLSVLAGDKWMPVGELSNRNKSLDFPVKTTRCLRLDITAASNQLELSELEAYGPEQPVPPLILPHTPGGSSGEMINIDNVTIAPAINIRGGSVKIDFLASAGQPLKKDYYFLVDVKETGALSDWLGDFEVASSIGNTETRSSNWHAGEKYPVSAEIYLPDYAPPGVTDIKITAISRDGKESAVLSKNKLGEINVRNGDKIPAMQEFPKASLEFDNGQFGFKIGGKFYLPFFMRYLKSFGFERFYQTKASGIDLQYFMMYNRCLGQPKRQEYFDRMDMNIRNMLRVRPESYIMVGVDLRPCPAWLKANPDELMLDAFGGRPCDIKGEPGMESFGSQKYENDCKEFLSALMEFLSTKPYAGRIVAWHPWIGSQLDSFIGGIQQNFGKPRSQISIGDFHPGAIAMYQDWLRNKYHGSVDELRKAWKNDQVTFATARPVISELVKEGANGGVFRDPLVCPAAYDYLEFFPSLLGAFDRRIAGFIKEKTGNKALVMFHYGAVTTNMCSSQPSGTRAHVNNFDLPEMLKDPNIDMYVYAPNYHLRHSGQPYVVWPPVDSLTLHNRMFLADNDSRTFSAGTLEHGRHRGEKETRAVMMYDMTWHLLKNTGAWFSDMSYYAPHKWSAEQYPWFAQPATTKAMRQTIDIFTNALKKEHASAAEVAVFISVSTPRYEDIYMASPVYLNLIERMLFKEINMLGAPYDIYMMNDLSNPRIKKDYKLYVFLNPFFMNAEERLEVNKLKKDGKTLLWFYAPGYVDKTRGLITEGIQEVTGIKISAKPDKEIPQLKISSATHPVTRQIAGKEYISEGYGDGVWGKLHPAAYSPIFYVDDPLATGLGSYPDGKTAFAVRKFKDWNSVYCAVPFLDAKALRNIANFAGVHLYCHENVLMAADNRFLMFNNGYEESKTLTIFLPGKYTVTDAISGEAVSSGQKIFKLEMKAPETRILSLY